MTLAGGRHGFVCWRFAPWKSVPPVGALLRLFPGPSACALRSCPWLCSVPALPRPSRPTPTAPSCWRRTCAHPRWPRPWWPPRARRSPCPTWWPTSPW